MKFDRDFEKDEELKQEIEVFRSPFYAMAFLAGVFLATYVLIGLCAYAFHYFTTPHP